MANLIRILPDDIAGRIAAGEVVERPASVVKELVENSIDAGSDRIDVEIGNGGKTEIRISDNGCGMSRDDALLCLERHATSKIFDLQDLRSLKTLGFRGEALPSIAAVSRLVIETRQEVDVEGTRLVVEGSRIRDVGEAGRARGTTVSARSLFFNVPARRKFLKATDTELRHVVQTVTGLSLANPDITFTLVHNGREMLNLARGTRNARIESVFGVDLEENAVAVEHGANGVRLWGFAGLPELARKSGAQQALIVNGRWVQHKALSYAVYDGYGGLIPKGFYPAYFLYVQLDPSRLDVNVHPSKREVRFADERPLYRLVAEGVRRAFQRSSVIPELTSPVSPSPSWSQTDKPGSSPDGSSSQGHVDVETNYRPSHPTFTVADRPFVPSRPRLERDTQMALPLAARPRPAEVTPVGAPAGSDDDTAAPHVSSWQLHNRYIMAHTKSGLIIIDQHVAHERILYEQTLDHFHSEPGTGQRLLFPITIDFGLNEIEAIRDAMPLLEKMGFGIRDFGGNTVVIDAIPVDLKVWEDGHLLREVVGTLMDDDLPPPTPAYGDLPVTSIEHRLAASYACHASVRSGDPLSQREMQGLIDQLFATREPFACPHGRPIVVKLSLEELDHRFGRS